MLSGHAFSGCILVICPSYEAQKSALAKETKHEKTDVCNGGVRFLGNPVWPKSQERTEEVLLPSRSVLILGYRG